MVETAQVADANAPSRTDEIRATNREVLAEMRQRCPEFVQWASRLARRGGNLVDASRLTIKKGGGIAKPMFCVTLFTQRHLYWISARPPVPSDTTNADDGYLGCIAQARKPLAGEDWTRGNDLPDGPYSEATWNEIVHGILGYELVRLGK